MFVVGDRVQHVDGSVGTLKYIGPVVSAKEKDASVDYYGIEWDNGSTRGKHNGTITNPSTGEKVVYFTTSSPLCASFVKQKSLITTPVTSILEALNIRYNNTEHHDSKKLHELPESNGHIEIVGMDSVGKKQKLQLLEEVDLSNMTISSINSEENASSISQITRVNLSKNLLQWKNGELMKNLSTLLPNLVELNLSRNQLGLWNHDNSFVLPSLKVLVLNHTSVSWNDCLSIASGTPVLSELYLKGNLLPAAADKTFEIVLPTLTVLDLSDNSFTWETLTHILKTLPALSTLNVDTNSLVDLKENLLNSPCLLKLSVSGNQITSWDSINNLSVSFPALESLRLSLNPLTSGISTSEARVETIARMKSLKSLNNSIVRPKERIDCEKLYLKRICKNLESLDDLPVSQHPRFEELKAQYPEAFQMYYGSVGKGGDGGDNSATLAHSIVSVKLYSMVINEAMTMEAVVKKLPLKMTVAQLKVLLEKRFKVKPGDQVVTYRDDPKSLPMPLDDDSSELAYYGIRNDSEIILNEKS